MTKQEALKQIEDMPEDKFQELFKELPARVQIILNAGFADWKEIIPIWYMKLSVDKSK